jgi:hypothetical protein
MVEILSLLSIFNINRCGLIAQFQPKADQPPAEVRKDLVKN